MTTNTYRLLPKGAVKPALPPPPPPPKRIIREDVYLSDIIRLLKNCFKLHKK